MSFIHVHESMFSLKPPKNTQLLTAHVEPELILHSRTGPKWSRTTPSENRLHPGWPRVSWRLPCPHLIITLLRAEVMTLRCAPGLEPKTTRRIKTGKKNFKEAAQETGSGLKLQKNKAGEKNQN